MAHPEIILASSSPYRKKLLLQLGLSFSCESPAINETARPYESAEQLCLRLSQEKALKVADNHVGENTLIIASDQVAGLGSHTLSKPGNHSNAVQQLTACSGQRVTFYTGLCLYHAQIQKLESLVEKTTVYFKTLNSKQIEYYLQKEMPYDCAGSFKVEGLGISLFDKIEANDPNNLIGLPLIQLNNLLIKAGIDVLTD